MDQKTCRLFQACLNTYFYSVCNALLICADAVMYAANNAGRNQTVLIKTQQDAIHFPLGADQQYGYN